MDDFLTDYLHYTEDTEAHKVYHRWSAITSIGALLGRNSYIPFGHSKIYANFYCMLLGEPGARKSSAIKLIKKLLGVAGYDAFSADRSSREKFLLDLGGDEEEEGSYESNRRLSRSVRNGHDITDMNLWNTLSSSSSSSSAGGSREIKEVFIIADEFNEFVSAGNVDFYTTLGNLWDWDNEERPFEDKVKNSRSVSIYQPTVSLLGGNTQENFARAFPPELLGHGFLSRLLLIHGIPSGRKISRPLPPSKEATTTIISRITEMQKRAARQVAGGELLVNNEGWALLDKIYRSHGGITDPRFKGYNTRRYTHLLKLIIITAACMGATVVDEEVVIYANTMLSALEVNMPQAIGEFGKSKHSDISNLILGILQEVTAPITTLQIYRRGIHKHLNKPLELQDIMNNLRMAEKIQYVQLPGGKGGGWLPKKEVGSEVAYVDWNLLSEEERNML